MDQNNMKIVNSVNAADQLLNADLLTSTQIETELTALKEWEMALVGGGDGLVCW